MLDDNTTMSFNDNWTYPRIRSRMKMNRLPTLEEDRSWTDSPQELAEICADESFHEFHCCSPQSRVHCCAAELAQLDTQQLITASCQLQRAYRQLKQAHDVNVSRLRSSGLARPSSLTDPDLSTAQLLIDDLERALLAGNIDPAVFRENNALTARNLELSQKLSALEARHNSCLQQLREVQEHSELLEFRLLELEGGQDQTDCEIIEGASEAAVMANVPTCVASDDCVCTDGEHVSLKSSRTESWENDRVECQKKIALLQNSILQLESALTEANARVRQATSRDDRVLTSRATGAQSGCGRLSGGDVDDAVINDEESLVAISYSPVNSRQVRSSNSSGSLECRCHSELALDTDGEDCTDSSNSSGNSEGHTSGDSGCVICSRANSPVHGSSDSKFVHVQSTRTVLTATTSTPHQRLSSSCDCCSRPGPLQRCMSSGSDSELSDYHSDSADSRTPQPSASSGEDLAADLSPDPRRDLSKNFTAVSTSESGCEATESCNADTNDHPSERHQLVRRRACNFCRWSSLQESGIFEVDYDDKAVQTDCLPSTESASMREFVDLNSEVARLTSIQEQLQHQHQQQQHKQKHQQTPQLPFPDNSFTLPNLFGTKREQNETQVSVGDCAGSHTDNNDNSVVLVSSVSVQTDYNHNQLLCDYEHLLGRFKKSQRLLQELEDEKNELEEAENDARLMVQRLEMKVYASSEVERMLSSDLADEQERSSQLQRQLTSIKLKRQAEIKALQSDQDRVQLIQRIKQLESVVSALNTKLKHTENTKPFMEDKAISCDMWTAWREVDDSFNSANSSGSMPSPMDHCSATVSTGSQTSLSIQMEQTWRFTDSDKAVLCEDTKRSIKRSRSASTDTSGSSGLSSESHAVCQSPLRCLDCHRQLTPSPNNSVTSENCEAATADRERYYTDCIQRLETEKFTARKDWETEKAGLLKTIEQSSQEQGLCKQKLEATLAECDNIRRTLNEKVMELNRHLHEQSQSFEATRQQMVSANTHQLQSLNQQGAELQQRVAAIEQSLSLLDSELDIDRGNDSGSLRTEDVAALVLHKVRSLKDLNRHMASQVVDLEKKEAAYKETMENADTIMRQVETRYQQTIGELERRLEESRNQLTFLERTVVELNSSSVRTDGEQERSVEMLTKLVSTQQEIHTLRQQLSDMDKQQQELSVRLRQEEWTNSNLRHQLLEHDEMTQDLQRTRSELVAYTEQVDTLTASRQRLIEQQQSSDFLLGRVEELEQLEANLKASIKDLKTSHCLRESSHQEKVDRLKSEMDSLQATNLTYQQQLEEADDKLEKMERQLLVTQKKLSDTLEEVSSAKNSSSQMEVQLRQEVSKARSQLRAANQQLLDGESGSAQLRQRLCQLESANDRLQAELQSQTAQAEQDVVKLNLEISRYDEEVGALTDQLNSSRLSTELDSLADRESTIRRLALIVQQANTQIQSCDQCRGQLESGLASAAADLDQLVSLLAGTVGDQSLQAQLRNALVQESNIVTGTDSVDASCQKSSSSSSSNTSTATPSTAVIPSTDTASSPLPVDVCTVGIQTASACDSPPAFSSQALLARVQQLSEQLQTKDDELHLVDRQGSQLQMQLESRDHQLQQLRDRLVSSNSQLQQLRDSQQQLSQQLQQLQQEVHQWSARASSKDTLLAALLRHLRRILRTKQTEQLLTALKRRCCDDNNNNNTSGGHIEESSGIVRQQQQQQQQQQQCCDYDTAAVCDLLTQWLLTMRKNSSSPDNLSDVTQSSSDARSFHSRIPRPVLVSSPTNTSSDCSKVANIRRFLSRRSTTPSAGRSLLVSRQMPLVGVARPFLATPTHRLPPRGEKIAVCASLLSPMTAPLPSPEQFQIIKQVGCDSLLLYWSAAKDPRITGYEIFVDNKLRQVIRNPGRTKALLPSLPLSNRLQLAMRSISSLRSRVSSLVWTEYVPKNAKSLAECGRQLAPSRRRLV